MEAWRIVSTALTAVVGGLLTLGTMGQVRDRRHRYRGKVARTGAYGFAMVAVCTALAATVLPADFSWALIIAGALIAAVLMVTG